MGVYKPASCFTWADLPRYDDSYTPDPGEVKTAPCGICGKSMSLNANINDYRSWGGAMARKKSNFDHFTCNDTDKDWHKQAKALKREIYNTQSPSLREMLFKDMQRVLTQQRTIL